ncbi:MAG: hypothetical protein JWN67_679 [Actinomycetia bacterium]|nr:hypothetical protein [Actinomycetes bacterium]
METRLVRRRSHTRTSLLLIGLLAAFIGLVVLPSGRMNQATTAEVSRSGLLDPGADLLVENCADSFEGSAVVHFPVGSFDADQTVLVTASDSGGWASGGGTMFPMSSTVVRVHVPPGTNDGDYAMAISAAGLRSGKPTELHATLTVRVRCSGR